MWTIFLYRIGQGICMLFLPQRPGLNRSHRQGGFAAVCLLLAATIAGQAWAEIASIQLNDGSVIRGEVVSLKGGTYQVRTQSLGVVRVPQDDVQLVSYQPTKQATVPAAGTSAGAMSLNNPQAAGMFQGIQQQIMSNPDLMRQVQSMANDPALQSVLSDPSIKQAMDSGNFSSLMSNPKIKTLLEHRTVKQITQQVK